MTFASAVSHLNKFTRHFIIIKVDIFSPKEFHRLHNLLRAYRRSPSTGQSCSFLACQYMKISYCLFIVTLNAVSFSCVLYIYLKSRRHRNPYPDRSSCQQNIGYIFRKSYNPPYLGCFFSADLRKTMNTRKHVHMRISRLTTCFNAL